MTTGWERTLKLQLMGFVPDFNGLDEWTGGEIKIAHCTNSMANEFCARWIRRCRFLKRSSSGSANGGKSMSFFQTTSGVALMMTSERTAASRLVMLQVFYLIWMKINNAAMYWIFEFLLWRYSSTHTPTYRQIEQAAGRSAKAINRQTKPSTIHKVRTSP